MNFNEMIEALKHGKWVISANQPGIVYRLGMFGLEQADSSQFQDEMDFVSGNACWQVMDKTAGVPIGWHLAQWEVFHE